MRVLLYAAFLSTVSLSASPAQQAGSGDAETERLVAVSEKLAGVLRNGRAVISANQSLINDPNIGDKGLTPEVFFTQLREQYEANQGGAILSDDLGELEHRLVEAQLAAMRRVIEENQAVMNAPGIEFKGFIPAVFARLTNEHFGNAMGAEARIKVTAPLDLVRNRKARPDDWETNVLENSFRSDDWEMGKPFFEVVDADGETAFRMLIPEYYSDSCLSCHGSPAGEVDVTGFPKEGGKAGELAGAISVTLR